MSATSPSALAGPQQFATRVADVRVRGLETVRYLLIVPAGAPPPKAAVILFAGGNGLLNIGLNGMIGTNLAQNFLVRSRQLFAANGLAVAVVDAPGGAALNGNIRLSANYAQTMAHVIADLRSRARAEKVWLVGTSAGTLSAVGVASRLRQDIRPLPPRPRRPGTPDGIVLTSTQSQVTGSCRRTVFDANLSAINVPAYVVAHAKDGCACSPADLAPSVLSALTGAPAKDSLVFTDSAPPISPDPCQARTPHGFLGVENSAVTAIADWVKAH